VTSRRPADSALQAAKAAANERRIESCITAIIVATFAVITNRCSDGIDPADQAVVSPADVLSGCPVQRYGAD
jgi:hypothetical protein